MKEYIRRYFSAEVFCKRRCDGKRQGMKKAFGKKVFFHIINARNMKKEVTE